jgi:hypothetical protein
MREGGSYAARLFSTVAQSTADPLIRWPPAARGTVDPLPLNPSLAARCSLLTTVVCWPLRAVYDAHSAPGRTCRGKLAGIFIRPRISDPPPEIFRPEFYSPDIFRGPGFIRSNRQRGGVYA